MRTLLPGPLIGCAAVACADKGSGDTAWAIDEASGGLIGRAPAPSPDPSDLSLIPGDR